MANTLYARYTSRILDKLPHWFEMRKKSRKSLGARFLNISGLQLDDAKYILDYAYEQCYINTADITQVDYCYKAVVSMPHDLKYLNQVIVYNGPLHEAASIKEFYGIQQNGVSDPTAWGMTNFFADRDRNIIYVREPFNIDAIHNDGKIKCNFRRPLNPSHTSFDEYDQIFPLKPHHVWNFFDEFGALVGCKRIPREPNVEYKERILDVFKNPSNASRDGLINGIGRELALRRNIIWADPHEDIELNDSMIVLNSIKVNGLYIDREDYELDYEGDELLDENGERILIKKPKAYLTESGTVLIKAYDDDLPRKDYSITYVHGLEMHQLWNRNDTKLYNELYTVEQRAKPLLRSYKDIVEAEAPILWDHFHWNEHFWDQNDPEDMEQQKQISYIPNLYDARIDGFKDFKTSWKEGTYDG